MWVLFLGMLIQQGLPRIMCHHSSQFSLIQTEGYPSFLWRHLHGQYLAQTAAHLCYLSKSSLPSSLQRSGCCWERSGGNVPLLLQRWTGPIEQAVSLRCQFSQDPFVNVAEGPWSWHLFQWFLHGDSLSWQNMNVCLQRWKRIARSQLLPPPCLCKIVPCSIFLVALSSPVLSNSSTATSTLSFVGHWQNLIKHHFLAATWNRDAN